MSNFNQSRSSNNLSLVEQLFPLTDNLADSDNSNNFNSEPPFLSTQTDFTSLAENFVFFIDVDIEESFLSSILTETQPATEEPIEDFELLEMPLGEPELSPTQPATEEPIEDFELLEMPLGEPELSPTQPATEEPIEDFELLEMPLGEPELSPEEEATLTQSVTVGNPEGTQFTFNYAEGIDQEFIDGVSAAAEDWSSRLTDDVDIIIDLTFTPEEEGAQAVAIPNFIPITYGRVRQALIDDATSSNDEIATANLMEGDNLSLLINNTSENDGSDTPYLDDNGGLNNSYILLNSANAKALGLSLEELAAIVDTTPEDVAANISLVSDNYPVDANAADALINFDSETVWDFDRSDGIGLEAIDFVGVATHEIGHVLGFNSSTADDLDAAANPNLDALDVLAPLLPEDITAETEMGDAIGLDLDLLVDAVVLDPFVSENQYIPQTFDLFRYSPESVEVGALDFTAGNISDKYFSIDGGQTEIAPLSTGLTTGDFQQLSHWLDDDSIGIMAPITSPGEQEEITDTDLLAFDVIGWDLAST